MTRAGIVAACLLGCSSAPDGALFGSKVLQDSGSPIAAGGMAVVDPGDAGLGAGGKAIDPVGGGGAATGGTTVSTGGQRTGGSGGAGGSQTVVAGGAPGAGGAAGGGSPVPSTGGVSSDGAGGGSSGGAVGAGGGCATNAAEACSGRCGGAFRTCAGALVNCAEHPGCVATEWCFGKSACLSVFASCAPGMDGPIAVQLDVGHTGVSRTCASPPIAPQCLMVNAQKYVCTSEFPDAPMYR